MADPWISPREFQLLKKEVEVLGEQLNRETHERGEEIERLRFELERITETLNLHLELKKRSA